MENSSGDLDTFGWVQALRELGSSHPAFQHVLGDFFRVWRMKTRKKCAHSQVRWMKFLILGWNSQPGCLNSQFGSNGELVPFFPFKSWFWWKSHSNLPIQNLWLPGSVIQSFSTRRWFSPSFTRKATPKWPPGTQQGPLNPLETDDDHDDDHDYPLVN